MAFELPQELYSKADAGNVLRDIDILLDSLYKTDKNIDISAIGAQMTRNMPEGREGRKQFLNDLRTTIQNLPVIKLTLAYQPTRAQTGQIVSWLRQHYAPNLLVEVSYEPDIIAGAIIEYNGKYVDMSAVKKLDNVKVSYEGV